MKESCILVGFFVAGVALGVGDLVPQWLVHPQMALYTLYGLLILVGIGIGCDTGALQAILRLNIKTAIMPLAVAVGSLAGAGIAALLLLGISFREGVAVGAGFGYYSLSSVLISQIHGEQLGTVALLSNIIREVLTILLAPLLARWCGFLAPIAAGGATTMDTTLPIIHKATTKHYAMIAVINGIVLSLLVPVLVPAILYAE
ncbi:MAG: lysine exporter LysO family protein [Desulfohalobium sp.]